MSLQTDTVVGNKKPSTKLKGMLVDLRDTTRISFNNIEEKMGKIRTQAHSEGFNEQQIRLLLKQYLGDALTRRRIKYLIYEVPKAKEQKKLREDLAEIGKGTNMPIEKPEPETVNIPTDYKVVIPDWVLEEETKQLEREQKQQEDTESVNEVFEEFNQQPNYKVENLKIQLDNARNKITELTIQNKNLEERYKQLKARTTVQPSNNVPALQGNILRTKIVVNPFFREVI